MNRVRSSSSAIARIATPGWQLAVIGSVIVLATMAAYANSLNVPFLFDDNSAIMRNASIHRLWSLDALTAPLNATGATGRPLVNLSLALNYALGGNQVFGYHIFNLALHAASALLLFGVVRRTLQVSLVSEPLRNGALPTAALIALLWALHPLQTESVTCIIQRTELLGGFFLLLTFYCFTRVSVIVVENPLGLSWPATPRPTSRAPARSHTAIPRPEIRPAAPFSRLWAAATITSCALGMAAKEFLVVAPVLILLYDRTFIGGTFRATWTQRRLFYVGLSATWLVLAVLLSQTPQRNHNVGFGLGVSSWNYLLTQCHALVVYLKLAVWPHPLVLDYGTGVITQPAQVWWQGLFLIGLFLLTIGAVWRRPAIGFLGAWFFLILAPSSSFVPLVTQTMAEHRMYLPLASILVAGVMALWWYAARQALVIGCVLVAVCAGLTWQRNRDYANAVSIWSDTALKAPENYRAHYNLANALVAARRPAEAATSYATAATLRPNSGAIHHNLAVILGQLGRSAEAIAHYESAIRLEPNAADIRINFAAELAQAGRLDDAIVQYGRAAELDPNAADIHASLAYALLLQNRTSESIAEYRVASTLDPDNREIRDALNKLLRPQDTR